MSVSVPAGKPSGEAKDLLLEGSVTFGKKNVLLSSSKAKALKSSQSWEMSEGPSVYVSGKVRPCYSQCVYLKSSKLAKE